MPFPKSPKNGRKKPQQARAQATVSAILDGAVQVLDRDGPDLMNTTRVAEVAGVSVGTLYQYFADRESILDALQEREFERAIVMLRDVLARTTYKDEREQTHAVVHGLLQLYRAAPGLHRLLAIDGMRVSPQEQVVDFDRKIVDTLRGFFELTPFRVERKNKHAAAFVLYQSVRATLLAAILEEPAGLTDELLIEELTDLVTGHLVRPALS